MRTLFSLFSICLSLSAIGQKEDYNWMLSGGNNVFDTFFTVSQLSFKTGSAVFTNTYLQYPAMSLTNTSISDENGDLVCYTNGVDLFNSDHELVENGAAFHSPTSYPNGFVAVQGAILYPYPGHAGSYVLLTCDEVYFYFNGWYSLGCSPTKYSIIDMNENNGFGKVLVKNEAVNFDTSYIGQYTGVKHGNGRDFWAIGAPNYGTNKYYKYLIDPTGVKLHSTQEVGNIFNPGLGQGAISPDGEHIAYYNWFGIIGIGVPTSVSIDLLDFDRCTGEMSNPVQIIYPGLEKPGGIAFSPNSRFVYAAAWDEIYQFDLWADDVPASRVTVAEYDGFIDERGYPTRFNNAKLGPDGKVYITVSNVNSRYMHVIDQPDSLGTACNVLQHHILMPSYADNFMPNHPVTRLGVMVGSPCDTILSSGGEVLTDFGKFELHPNPASSFVEISVEAPAGKSMDWQLFTLEGILTKQAHLESTGKTVVPLEGLPDGIYVYKLTFEDKTVRHGKLVITRP